MGEPRGGIRLYGNDVGRDAASGDRFLAAGSGWPSRRAEE